MEGREWCTEAFSSAWSEMFSEVEAGSTGEWFAGSKLLASTLEEDEDLGALGRLKPDVEVEGVEGVEEDAEDEEDEAEIHG
jgi:hypothetical protein